jgi:hypothetical protein
VGTSASHNPIGLHGLLQGQLYLTLPPSVIPLSRENVGASASHNPMGLHGLLQGQLYLTLPPSVIRLSRENGEPRRLTTLWAFTAFYRDSFTLFFRFIFFGRKIDRWDGQT